MPARVVASEVGYIEGPELTDAALHEERIECLIRLMDRGYQPDHGQVVHSYARVNWLVQSVTVVVLSGDNDG